jgi:Protein of unknown function (DUF2917)
MITLGPQQSLRVEPSNGNLIACHSGVIWVTREGDPRDFILSPGDSVEVGSGVTMVMALEPTVLSIAKRGGVSWPRRMLQALRTRVRPLQRPRELVTLRTL